MFVSTTHFADAEPFQFRMFIADIGGFTALPGCHGIDVMQCIAIEIGLPFPYRCDQPESGWLYPDFLLNLPD